jgi:Mrp family chromosome partitioning ATPase
MRGHYDMIIIGTPPVLVVPDARVIGQFVDAIIYSVRWDDTPKSQVKVGINLLESVGLKVTGLVLSQVDPKGVKRYGYGGYGGYGQSYKGYYEN